MTVEIKGQGAPNPTQMKELQDAFSLAGFATDTHGNIVLTGPGSNNRIVPMPVLVGEDGSITLPPEVHEAVQAAAGLDYNPDGSVSMQIVPRTGTLAALMALAGSAGELASATDIPAIVKFTGVAGKAQSFLTNGRRTLLVSKLAAPAAAVAQPPQDPDTYQIVLTINQYVSQINECGRMNNGLYPGQTVEIYNATSLSPSLYYASDIVLPPGFAARQMWNGTAWQVLDMRNISGANPVAAGSAVLAWATSATGVSAVSVGPGALANGESSFAVMGGLAEGAYSMAYNSGTASGSYSYSFGGNTMKYGGVAFNGTAHFMNQSAFQWCASVPSTTIFPQHSIALLGRRTTTATPAVMTANGAAAQTADNVLNGTTWTGTRFFEATIIGVVPGSAFACVFKRQGVIYSNGTTAQLVGAVDTVGTDRNTGITGTPAVSIAIGATYQDLQVTVTGSTQVIIWSARIVFTEAVSA